jgi:phage gp29-like protein
VEHNGEGSRAATEVHREVELDLFETYAEYIVAILNDQLIPQLIAQNWGTANEVPFVEVEITRPEREQEMATRDKTLFVDMGLPVSLQFLYERHRVPTPCVDEALFQPPKPIAPIVPTASATNIAKACACGCGAPIDAASESAASLAARQAAAEAAFPAQLAEAEAAGDYLVWDAVLDGRTTPGCLGRHGHRWGDGWGSPPPAHYNCRSSLIRVPKAAYQPPK